MSCCERTCNAFKASLFHLHFFETELTTLVLLETSKHEIRLELYCMYLTNAPGFLTLLYPRNNLFKTAEVADRARKHQCLSDYSKSHFKAATCRYKHLTKNPHFMENMINQTD